MFYWWNNNSFLYLNDRLEYYIIIIIMKRTIDWKKVFTRENLMDFLLITIGCLIQAVGMIVFMVPANLITGGISGLAQVLNHYTGWPIGIMVFLGNLPILLIGWRYLGRFRFALRTIYAVVIFSVFTDILNIVFHDPVLTNDVFLNTIFGAVILGIGFGMVYRGGGTSGGSDIIGRIFNHRMGIPLTLSYMLTDSLSILLGAVAFGWELALYGLISVYVSGVAAEMVSEGSGLFRDVMIISSKPEAIARAIIEQMEHSVTFLNGVGGYTGEQKRVIYAVINRSEVNQLKRIVTENDPAAFMVVGQSNEVLGEGFQTYRTLD